MNMHTILAPYAASATPDAPTRPATFIHTDPAAAAGNGGIVLFYNVPFSAKMAKLSY
jgi:hypothetical protein